MVLTGLTRGHLSLFLFFGLHFLHRLSEELVEAHIQLSNFFVINLLHTVGQAVNM